jgi:hypothetical protein
MQTPFGPVPWVKFITRIVSGEGLNSNALSSVSPGNRRRGRPLMRPTASGKLSTDDGAIADHDDARSGAPFLHDTSEENTQVRSRHIANSCHGRHRPRAVRKMAPQPHFASRPHGLPVQELNSNGPSKAPGREASHRSAAQKAATH